MKSLCHCFSHYCVDSPTGYSICVSQCPAWLRFFDSYSGKSNTYLSLLRNLYIESVDFDFHFSTILTYNIVVLHTRELLFVACDPVCRNREILRLFLIELCENDASLAISFYFYCQIHWTSIEKTDHHLFLQKLQLLSYQQIRKLLSNQDLFANSTLVNSLYSHSFSFFSTLFSLSSFLYTLPLQDRDQFFIQQCHSLNLMTLSHFHELWLPLGKGMLIHSIYTPGCKVISTKSRCPCVIEFEVFGHERKSNKEYKHLHSNPSLSSIPQQSSFFQWCSHYIPFLHSTTSLRYKDYEESIPEQDDSYLVVSSKPHNPSFSHFKVIIKTRDTIRQEEMISHVLHEIHSILKSERIPTILHCYDVVAFSDDEGIIEYLSGFSSFHDIKKTMTSLGFDNFSEYFQSIFERNSKAFHRFRRNFIHSLATYSIVCYILQIKDRHDGNILLNTRGVLVHIDFGFILSNSPGNIGFETAPFKLTSEMMQLVGAPGSSGFYLFQSLCTSIYECLCLHKSQILSIIQLYAQQYPSLPCFSHNTQRTLVALDQRLSPKESPSDTVKMLIQQSIGSWTTHWYDQFQFYITGIL